MTVSTPVVSATPPAPDFLAPKALDELSQNSASEEPDGLDRVGASSFLWDEQIRRYGSDRATWVGCDRCGKWRPLPSSCDAEDLPDKWYCELHPDPQYSRCSAPACPVPLGCDYQVKLPACCTQDSISSRADSLQEVESDFEIHSLRGGMRGGRPFDSTSKRRKQHVRYCSSDESEYGRERI